MLEPKPFPLMRQDAKLVDFVLHKFPAIAGREIVIGYPLGNMPKMSEYKVSEEIMLKLMGYVGVQLDDGNVIQLTTRALVDNHCGDWETIAKLEWAMLEYNCTFLSKGLNSVSLESISQKAIQWIFRTLTGSSEPLSEVVKRALKS